MKRIIKDKPQGMFKLSDYPQGVMYDDMIDWIADDETDHTGALYVAIDHPVFEMVEGERVKKSDHTEIIPPDTRIKKRHSFAGWEPVGQDIPHLPVVPE